MINFHKITRLYYGGYCTALLYWIVSAALVVVLAYFSDLGRDNQTKEYCEMVEINKDTGGKYGWPDYKESYNEVCSKKLDQ